jgi:hypothetical protein
VRKGTLRMARSEEEFRQFCDGRPGAGVANDFPGGMVLHRAGCHTLNRKNHVEGDVRWPAGGPGGRGSVFRVKWLADTVDELKVRWPTAYLCGKCL